MQKMTRVILLFCAIIFPFGTEILAQFTFKPKRTNLIINHNDSTGWIFKNSSNTKTYFSTDNENLYLQIIDGELRVYPMTIDLWNLHPNPHEIDLINVPYTKIDITKNPVWFDRFSSFWVSSSGGHIRIFKYPETVTIGTSSEKNSFSNQNVLNYLFLNKEKKTLITSSYTVFMITPRGSVFEIDPGNKTWRLITKNRQLTAWTSEALPDKMVFDVFRKEDYKHVIPIKSDENKFYFQIIDHERKMGIASLSKDYFQIVIEIAPAFDFISPSISTNFHLVYHKNKLGILSFADNKNTDGASVPYQINYTNAKKTLGNNPLNPSISSIQPDNISFTPSPKEENQKLVKLRTPINFELNIIDSATILYSEFNDAMNVHNSGLYNIPQSKWFISPNYSRLTKYPTSIIETKQKNNVLSYTIFTSNGYINASNISLNTSESLKMITSVVTNIEIDSITPIPTYGNFTYKFQQNNKWGLVRIQDQNVSILVEPNYDWIEQFGHKKSLLLANQNQFDWYGINYCNDSLSEALLPAHTSKLMLYEGNSNCPCNKFDTVSMASIEIFNNYYIYNYDHHAWIQETLGGKPTHKAKEIVVYDHFINLKNEASMKLLNKNLKTVQTNNYNKIRMFKNKLVLYHSEQNNLETKTGDHFKFCIAYSGSKPIKSVNKYENKYFNGKYFVVQKGDHWIIFDHDGKQMQNTEFPTFTAAVKFGNNKFSPLPAK